MDKATGKPVATKEESGDVDPSESEIGSEAGVTGKPVAYKTAAGKPCAPSKSACRCSRKAEKTEWSDYLQVSPATTHDTEAVLNDLDVKMAIWGIFLNAALRAAVHLGQDYEANLRYVKNDLWNREALVP